MKRRFIALLLLCLPTVWFLLPTSKDTTHPLPIANQLDRDAEERNKQDRRDWIEEMHRTAPGQDWRAIERGNGAALQEMRNLAMAEKSGHGRWTEVGSRNQAGRMHVAAVSVLGDSLYGGSSRGGVWKGSLDGQGWRPLSDNLWGGSHGLAVAGPQGGVITSVTDGGMVMASSDEGATWFVPAGLPANIGSVKRVARDAADPDRVWLMHYTNGNRLLCRSDDAGLSYSVALDLITSVGDFWQDRVAGGDIYVLDGTTLRVSADIGDTWTAVGTLPVVPSNVVLTASEAGAPTFYAAVRYSNSWRLYRSDDGGMGWVYRYPINDFWETLTASITDPAKVVFAGVELWKSTTGGTAFVKQNDWWEYYDDPVNMLHADFPGLDCLMLDGQEVWYACSDGGLYRSNDGLQSFRNISLEGLGVSQYYGTLTSVNDPDLLLAGAQDQGYQRSTGPSGERGPGWDFEQIISGDYGHLTSFDGSHSTVFSVYPGFVLVQQGELNANIVGTPDFPGGEDHSWLPFILADPQDERSFFFCGEHLVRGSWRGGDNVNYAPSAQDFTSAGGNYLTCVGISPADGQYRIAAVDNGRIWYSTDGGGRWDLSGDTGPQAHYFYGTAIAHSPTDSRVAWLGGSGYAGSAVYRTQDGGVTWEAAGMGLPSTLVYDLAVESDTHEAIYAATDAGPYCLQPGEVRWEYIGGTEAPLTTYWSVEAVPAAQLVRFGTYGRGIWDYDVSGVSAVPVPQVANSSLSSAPNPFNPRTTISFRMPAAGNARLDIHDARGRLVRTLVDGSLDAGPHEVVWNGQDGTGRGCASGLYLLRLRAGGVEETGRVLLAR